MDRGQMVKPVTDIVGKGTISERGSVANANFVQSKLELMIHLAPDGQIYSKMTGQPINTVDDLANTVRNGSIKLSQLSVDYVDMNGTEPIKQM
ncbi:hypothetical protein [Enterobacter roggenkampii]|uniref:Uncharacterized protein n=2 Tax=Enterobacter roggenkampii TaxID=1812935 RepID=A0ABD4RDP5_9ENTR|nr:hypothetical protein [Enterobacter roggenkampii]EKS7402177.1 hypothetical protein [Enterobacter roggenkampii]EKU9176411.1 hypothetical protein [Enterobacter roggenkampii MGH 34]EKU9559948.1 hypothetical protein [Enterobacter roggenkampii MGH 34]EKW7743779.1 hypothetical protein [Enterobacter roggenkampii]EKY4008719.1 hypothetical protein [Enterobacter roggenkampii]